MAFSFYRTITIDPTKVGGTGLTNFAVLVSGTYSYLATVANGGKVQNSNGFDVGFYSDAALTTKLDWEIELYTATTGVVVYWVRVSSVSASVNTVIYMAYGDASISTDQSNKTGVWNSNYQGVFHLPNGTSLNVNDSTVNAFNGTSVNTPTATTGQIDGGGAFVRASTQYVDIGSRAWVKNVAAVSLSAWINITQAAAQRKNIIGISNGTSVAQARAVIYTDNTLAGDLNCGGRAGDGEGFQGVTSVGTPISNATWAYVVGVIDYANDTITLYVNGSAISATGTVSFTATATSNTNALGAAVASFNAGNTVDGKVDEARVYIGALPGGWITAEYNNQNSPSTFYAVGNETPVAAFTFFFPSILQRYPQVQKVIGY